MLLVIQQNIVSLSENIILSLSQLSAKASVSVLLSSVKRLNHQRLLASILQITEKNPQNLGKKIVRTLPKYPLIQ